VFFFALLTIASGWCKVLKPIQGFNLTLIWGGLFHKLFHRLVENPPMGTVEKGQQTAGEHFEVHRSEIFFPILPHGFNYAPNPQGLG
jgi:ABC-type phosphate/phosphonate transport system permease subunit